VAQARIDADTINAATSSVGATLDAKTLVVETLTRAGVDHVLHSGTSVFTGARRAVMGYG
jgi:hypothetical protein